MNSCWCELPAWLMQHRSQRDRRQDMVTGEKLAVCVYLAASE
jgi:hypothetical protein